MSRSVPLEQWWSSLDEQGRAEALELHPHDFVPEGLAMELIMFGVRVEDVAVAHHSGRARTVTFAQPAELTRFLHRVRAAARTR